MQHYFAKSLLSVLIFCALIAVSTSSNARKKYSQVPLQRIFIKKVPPAMLSKGGHMYGTRYANNERIYSAMVQRFELIIKGWRVDDLTQNRDVAAEAGYASPQTIVITNYQAVTPPSLLLVKMCWHCQAGPE